MIQMGRTRGGGAGPSIFFLENIPLMEMFFKPQNFRKKFEFFFLPHLHSDFSLVAFLLKPVYFYYLDRF